MAYQALVRSLTAVQDAINRNRPAAILIAAGAGVGFYVLWKVRQPVASNYQSTRKRHRMQVWHPTPLFRDGGDGGSGGSGGGGGSTVRFKDDVPAYPPAMAEVIAAIRESHAEGLLYKAEVKAIAQEFSDLASVIRSAQRETGSSAASTQPADAPLRLDRRACAVVFGRLGLTDPVFVDRVFNTWDESGDGFIDVKARVSRRYELQCFTA